MARRKLPTLYRVKVILHPTGSRHGRVWVHALDPEVAAEAIAECARLDKENDDARTALAELLDEEARQAQAVDWDEIARQEQDDKAAAEALAVAEADEPDDADDETYALAA